MTANDSFRKRINSRHVAGSEGNIHKFACTYNVGRMWYGKKCGGRDPGDGGLAGRLRQIFIRLHCRAAYVPLQLRKTELQTLESDKHRANRNARLEREKVLVEPEPRELVDSLLEDLQWSVANREAIERQAKLCEVYGR